MKQKGFVKNTKDNMRIIHYLNSYYKNGIYSKEEAEEVISKVKFIFNEKQRIYFKDSIEDVLEIIDKVPIISIANFSSTIISAITLMITVLFSIFISLNSIFNSHIDDATEQIKNFTDLINTAFEYMLYGVIVMMAVSLVVFFIDTYRAFEKKSLIKLYRFYLRIIEESLEI